MLFFLIILRYFINAVKRIQNIKIIKNLANTPKNEIRAKIEFFLDINKRFFIVIFFFNEK